MSDSNTFQERLDELRKKLQEEVLDANWEMLEEHYKRGSLVLVDPALDLYDIGARVALDDVESVRSAMQKKQLIKVEAEHVKNLSQNKLEKNFNFIIVQPYVLIQKK